MPSKTLCFFCFVFFIEGNHCSDFWSVTKAKNIYIRVIFLLDKLLFTKGLFSPLFGQKWLFLVKLTHVLLLITKEWKKQETYFFPDERRGSTLYFGNFGVHIVTIHNILWVLEISQNALKCWQYGALCSAAVWQSMS